MAVCLDKSPELIVSLMAVLKAGSAYLPLDPEYPSDRLEFMLRNSGAKFVIADPVTLGPLSGLSDLALLTLNEVRLAAMTEQLGSRPLESTVDLSDIAYVVYTSGSSGWPKGVMVTHGNLASAYSAWEAEYRLCTDAHVHLQVASLSFDVFTGDLVKGALLGRDVGADTAGSATEHHAPLRDDASRSGRLWRVRAGRRARPYELLRLGGATSRLYEAARSGFRHLEGRRVQTFARPLRLRDSPRQLVRPQRGYHRHHLLRRADRSYRGRANGSHRPPVPEQRCLHSGCTRSTGSCRSFWGAVGGRRRGRWPGYVGDPETTEHRFVTMILGSEPLCLYRTGDVAKWDDAGGLHLIGRADSQIKVRGHRIEVGEIESRLTAMSAVSRRWWWLGLTSAERPCSVPTTSLP